ncbi:hypothetical protein BST27_02675 [Mycobacterium intermedium]|uniref:Twin-arginine translocation pathway signal n=1 Tax=Mycobacterium intermedium TaxID=28445 RepID=A0A1E3SIY4_MYCIE|nr:hypothetical protein [Mycobacterium intermedium]MCV6963896.1 hypothetical protein [Mycobacterium intermedium]ODR02134.1 hypothetical protein BHQ20_05335 [Mycobacterium intermedium]OPE52706.1 hypothetical protein BV508_01645 [Mycobacterium intermedium]ORB10237.1 hypothetical protein BST27_02675 [Mycobacterium intermedium]
MTVEHGSSLEGAETSVAGAAETPSAASGSGRTHGLATVKRWARGCLARWRSILATVLVVSAVSVAAGLYFVLYRPDQQVGDAAAQRAIQVASDGAVAVLTYSPDNLDRDIARAKSYLTGDFLAYYTKFSEQIAALALQNQVTQTAKVLRAAVSEIHADTAVVLVFLNQTVSSRGKPEPQTTANIAQVTVVKVDGSWLISKMDPLS